MGLRVSLQNRSFSNGPTCNCMASSIPSIKCVKLQHIHTSSSLLCFLFKQLFFFEIVQIHFAYPTTMPIGFISSKTLKLHYSISYCKNINYTVSQKNWANNLRPITLEILNRSLPNWAQITFSSF